jgi:hypothetical protein
MTTPRPETARELAERLLRECSRIGTGATWDEREVERLEFNRDRATALIEADRAAVREAAIRECIEKLEIMAGNPLATSCEAVGVRMGAERLRALLPAEKGPNG